MRKFILFIGVMVVVFSSGCDEKTFTLLAEDDSARVVEDGSVIIDLSIPATSLTSDNIISHPFTVTTG